jgi:hypothetical protein
MTVTALELASASFPHTVKQITVRETHISFVVLTGEFAYKVKKAVRLDFLDASTLERRRWLCEEEVRLNQRYAPDLYLGVTPIVRMPEGLRFGGTGQIVEYAVRMVQFALDDELDVLLEANNVTADEIARLAVRLGEAHLSARPLAPPSLATDDFMRIARANLASITERAPRIAAQTLASELQRWTEAEIAERRDRLLERERQGFIRECHGDLHARNIVRWRGELIAFDCIEFDPALRFIDVLNDLAFLVMDLMHRGYKEMAFVLLNRYLERTGDYTGLDVLPGYLVYRALVRAKVALIECEQNPAADGARRRAASRLHTASGITQRGAPTLIVMHGASGSGKSWLSERLAPALNAVRMRSDIERKRIAGVDPLAPRAAAFNEGLYTREFNDRTYAHLLACARASLQGRFNTIVDAAFLRREERDSFAALAAEQRARFRILACRADPTTLAARIEERRITHADPSDATLQVLQHQFSVMQAFAEEEAKSVLEIDTRKPDVLAVALQRLSLASP